MIMLNIKDDTLNFNNVSKTELPKILEWYNNTNDFKFATGIDKVITFEDLYQRYAEVLMCRHEFFVGLYLKEEENLIGVIRGGVNNKSKNALWINSIVIDNKYQNKGYGTKAIKLLLEHFTKFSKINKSYISVVDKNEKAKSFWNRLGFIELRKIDAQVVLDNEKHNVIIMEKDLNN